MLQKLEQIAKIIALVATPLVVAVLGARVQQREVDVRLLELGASVLMSPDLSFDSPLRAWAREVINTYAEVELTPEAAESFPAVEWPASRMSIPNLDLIRDLQTDTFQVFEADSVR